MDSNTEVKEIRIKEKQQVNHKRQKTAQNFKADDLGADISSPDKQPSTKQSEDEDDQPTTAASKHNKEVTVITQTSPQKTNLQFTQGPAMTSYLNEENLKHLQRITKSVKINFAGYVKQMIIDEKDEKCESKTVFPKKQYLNIAALQQRTQHLEQNKLSDKFSRRDIQFYDLYVKKENGEELALLKDKQFPLEIDADQYYDEMELEDFNNLFANPNLIEEKFGKTIKVQLESDKQTKANSQGLNLRRKVKEMPELVKVSGNRRQSDGYGSASKQRTDFKDPELMNLHQQLKQFELKYGKTHEEIADIFCRVSGQLDKIRDYLENKPVVEWTYLEDLALQKPDDSPEFQILLQSKGWEEIINRRDFLHAIPVIVEDEDKKN